MTQQKKIGSLIAILGWYFIAAMTLFPTPGQTGNAAQTSIWCLVCGNLGLVDVILNNILFLPLGLGLGLMGLRGTRALLVVLSVTLTIELLQLSVVAGRDASLSDLLTNTSGGGLGYGLGRWWRVVLFPTTQGSRALTWLGVAGWLGVQAFTGWALQRSLPRSQYYGNWAPVLGQFDWFTGQVLSVQLNGIPVQSRRLESSDLVRRELAGPRSITTIKATTGSITPRVAPIFSIFDEYQRQIMLVGQREDDLVFHFRTRLDQLRLRSPMIRLAAHLPAESSVPLDITAEYIPGRYRLKAVVGGRTVERSVTMSGGWGWSFLIPFEHTFGWETPWLTMLWIGGLLLPIGYLAARGRPAGASSLSFALALLLMLGAGLLAIPIVFDLAPGHAGEWLSGMAGAGFGWLLGVRSARHSPPSLLTTRRPQ